jgi:uncharacterized protein (TIGR02391 family)
VLNTEWAIRELDAFLAITRAYHAGWETMPKRVAAEQEIAERRVIAERILDRCYPAWREDAPPRGSVSWDWEPLQEMVMRGRALLAREQEIQENLGPAGPALSSSSLHQKVWSAAASLWNDGHFQEAVEAAARAVNGHLQTRVGRKDIDYTTLVDQAFGTSDPGPGQARLRLCDKTNMKLFNDLHQGALALGKGCFALFRNLPAHGHVGAASATEALEQLAAFSLFMRLVDRATVVTTPPLP